MRLSLPCVDESRWVLWWQMNEQGTDDTTMSGHTNIFSFHSIPCSPDILGRSWSGYARCGGLSFIYHFLNIYVCVIFMFVLFLYLCCLSTGLNYTGSLFIGNPQSWLAIKQDYSEVSLTSLRKRFSSVRFKVRIRWYDSPCCTVLSCAPWRDLSRPLFNV